MVVIEMIIMIVHPYLFSPAESENLNKSAHSPSLSAVTLSVLILALIIVWLLFTYNHNI